MQEIKPVDAALVEEAESGECRKCGRDFLFVEDALAHITTCTHIPDEPEFGAFLRPEETYPDMSAASTYLGRLLG